MDNEKENESEDFNTPSYQESFIGRSHIRCLQIKVADKYALGLDVWRCDPDRVQADIELMFDAMDALKIRKMHEHLFMNILEDSIHENIEFIESCRKKNRNIPEEIDKLLRYIREKSPDIPDEEIEIIKNELYSPQSSYIKEKLQRYIEEHPELFEIGAPEKETRCNMSCKGTIKVESREKGIFGSESSEIPGPEVTCVTYVEKTYCPFRDGLIPEIVWFDGRDIKLKPLTRKLSYDELKFKRLNIGNELLNDYDPDEHEFVIIRKNKY